MTGSLTNSLPSSGNSEDMFLSTLQCPSSSGVQATTGLDTSSADSGISVSFEPSAGGNGGGNAGGGGSAISIPGPFESCNSSDYSSGFIVQSISTSTPSELTNTSYAPGHQVSMSRTVEPHSVQLPVFLADNLQHKISELKAAAVVGPRFGIDQSIPSSSTVGTDLQENSVWTSISPSAFSVGVAPGHPGISKYQAQNGSREGLATWPATKSPTTAGGGGKSRSSSSNLLYNMFSKTEDGTRWQCEECKRLFSSQGSLRAHARIHTGERPYQCQYCFRTFCQASTLRSHERLHTGEKPYKCEHCGRAFTQSAGLRSHLKTHRYDC